MPDIMIKDENSLEINGKVYCLSSPPEYTDALVQEEVESVISQLSLKDITENLYLTVELLFVAYNGVAGARGGTIQAEIASIQSGLALLCNECVKTMSDFKEETNDIITLLVSTYKWLTNGEETLALKKLSRCAEASASMSKSARNLAGEFMELQVRSTKVRSNTIEEEAGEWDKKLAAEKAEREIRAKQAAEEKNNQELLAQIDEMQTKYNEAKSREEKESGKALIFAITSVVCSTIGAGVGAFAAAKNPMAQFTNGATASTTNPQALEAQRQANAAKAQSSKALQDLQTARDDQFIKQNLVDKLTSEIHELNKKIAVNAQKPEILDTLNKEKAVKNSALDTASKELTVAKGKAAELEKSTTDYTAAYAAAAVFLQNIAKSTGQMTQEAANVEESIRQEKMRFLNQKLELEKQKRQSLVKMEEYVHNIKNLKVEEGKATVSVNSLHAAIEALGKIIATLTNASLFWDQMSYYCQRMSDKGFQQMITNLTDPKSGLSVAVRVAEYRDADFMKSFFTCLCQWVAVNGLSGEYLISASKAQRKAVEYLRQSPTIEEALKRTPEIAKNMEIMIGSSLSKSGELIADLEQQKALITEGSNSKGQKV